VAPDLVFPEPVVTHGRCYMWLRSDIEAWQRRRACSCVASVQPPLRGSFYSPDVPKGAMVNHAKAATWEDEAEADAEAERLNERDRVPEYGATTTGSRC
jgi:hypothetical protein